jgi:hypothetical protein
MDIPTGRSSLPINPGDLLIFEQDRVGAAPFKLDFGEFGTVYLWSRRESISGLLVGTKTPIVTMLEADNLPTDWPAACR